jgi:hypothetical protein
VAHPGDRFPKLVVVPEGVFSAKYLGARERGNGRYTVEIQLERMR